MRILAGIFSIISIQLLVGVTKGFQPFYQVICIMAVSYTHLIFTFAMYALLFWFPMWSRLNLYFIGLFALIVPEAVSCEKDRKMRIFYYAGILAILLFFYIVPTLAGGGDWYYATNFDKLKELAAEKMIP